MARDQKGNSAPIQKVGASFLSAPVSRQRAERKGGAGKTLSFRRGLSIPQILDSFPSEARDLIPSQIARLSRVIQPYKKWVDGVYAADYDDFTKWFIVQASLCVGAPVKEMASLEKLKKLRSIMRRGGEAHGQLSSADILKAKYVPITSLVECKRRGGRWWACCPFHQDDTPSFVVNKDNSCHCFSCGFHSDSIGLVQKLYGYNFVEAVKWLLST